MKRTPLLITSILVSIVAMAFVIPSLPKVKQVTNLKSGKAREYDYAPDGNLLSIKNARGGGVFYEYSGKRVIKKVNDVVANTVTVDTFILNNKGLAEQRHNAQEWSTGISLSMEYNESGYSVLDRLIDKGKVMSTDRQIYKNNNRISLSQMSWDEKKPNILYYTFYTDKPNTIGNDNTGLGFMGHSSQNPMKESIGVSPSGDTARVFYRYHFDEKNRISIQVSYQKGKMLDSLGYTYY